MVQRHTRPLFWLIVLSFVALLLAVGNLPEMMIFWQQTLASVSQTILMR